MSEDLFAVICAFALGFACSAVWLASPKSEPCVTHNATLVAGVCIRNTAIVEGE